ncbi:mucin-5AC-like [Bufo gargarizans]|uniref:mucin-5AC-like n=1 Tax=Bufo gargarizans TaxID=30331 RepID=UPI001CF5C4CC|nr:mucin-5AC-like [Bufo gargarizans]
MWRLQVTTILELRASMEGMVLLVLWTASFVLIVNAQQKLMRGLNVSDVLFGNLHKASDPTEDCPDVVDNTQEQGSHQLDDECKDKRDQCETIMSQMGDCKYKMHSYKIYRDTCTEDLCKCDEKNQTICLCSNLNQFSKACLEAKGHPGMWRRPDFCYISCPNTMAFFECTSPCLNTCSNPTASKLCTELCKEGCSCPPGTVLDDVTNNKKCVKLNQCPCAHNGKIYKPAESYSAACQKCTCMLGQWTCSQVSCSGNCTLKGGSHIQTFDEKEYNFHGNCQYLMSKDADNKFAIIAKIIQCGMTETVTCLNTVYINLERMKIKICYCGNVYVNNFLVALPKITDKIAIYKRSAFYVYIVTPFGLSVKVQVKPVFQLFISLNSTFQNRTLGLCGNFNGIEGDDLTTISGVVEDAVSDFGNSYKIQASCSDVPDYFENPCSKNINKEEYAKHWCSHLVLSPIFALCHEVLDPKPYQKHCIYDACNSEHSEDAVCTWLGDYADECRSQNVLLKDWRWRYNICDPGCPESMVFMSTPRQCNFTCNSLAEPDILCHFTADPREGCSCPEGTYQTQNEKCVPPEDCPCNYKGRTVPARQTFKIDEILCKCIRGILECPMADEEIKACKPPMYYYDCSSPNPDTVGSQCQKSCKTQDMECYSNECVIGCVCPKGLVSDDNGGCIPPSECPCVYRGKFHDTGSTINISCNTCTCKNRTWDCTMEHCPKTCTLYGNGHLITFDQARNDISGGCDYILAQDFCPNNNHDGSFQIFIKHILCGHTNTICSLQIRIILLNITIDIYEGRVEEITKHNNGPKDNSYSITLMGQHIVFVTEYLTLMYDQKMTATVLLSNTTEGTVCGLCGDNDGRAANDLTSSWSQGCIHERSRAESPCDTNPEKLAWAQKHCNLINSEVFASCKSLVDPIPFYDTCVEDTCTCSNDIGDCECLCTSIAAYSAECRRHDICIRWRTPNICPVFCDYYNKDGHCVWHYDPCGTPCLKTCLNPDDCQKMEKLEGCYPMCSNERPYFDTENQICVDKLNCSVCTDKLCDEHTGECLCCYLGKTYRNGEPITEMIDGQLCITGYCIEGHLKDIDIACGYFTSQTTALTVTPEAFTQTLPKKTATLISEITKTDLSKYTHSALPYTNASTTTPKIYSSTQIVTVSVLSQSQPVTGRGSSILSGKVTESTSTTLISSPYVYAPTTLPSSATELSTSISTKETTQSPIPTSLPKTTHTTPVKSTYPALVSNTTTISLPYLKGSTTLKTKMTVIGTIPLITSKTTKLHTSTQSTIKTVLSKTTPYTTTFQRVTSKYTVSPPFSIALTTFKTKVTSTTPTSSTAKLSTSISTKESTQSTKQISLPKTIHTTPVKSTYPAFTSKTTTISSPYLEGSTSLKTKMTVTGTTPLTTSETTKLRTSTQSTIQTVLSKTTPRTTTFPHVTSKSTILPPYSKAPTTVKTKVTSTTPKKSSTAKQSTSISTKEATLFTKQISVPKTTHTTPVKSTYPEFTSKTTIISSPYPKVSTSLKSKMTITGTTPLKTSETTKLRTSTESTIKTVLSKTTPHATTFEHASSKSTVLPPYSKMPKTLKTKVTSVTPTSSSASRLSTYISTKATTPFTEQMSLPKTTRTTPVTSTYTALMSTIKTVHFKTTPYRTTFQHVTLKSTVSPPFSKAHTTLKTKVTSTTPLSSASNLSTSISTKETTQLTKQISLPKTTHTTPVESTYPAFVSNTTTISSRYTKRSTTLKTKITVTGTTPLITSKTTKLRTSTESTIKSVLSKTPHATTFEHASSKSTVLPPYSKMHKTLKTKVTSVTPTSSSTARLSSYISTKATTPFTEQMSLPKTTRTTPVKSTYPALMSKTTPISSSYPKGITTLKTQTTMTGTIPLITSKTTKLHTSTQSTIQAVLSKTTPHTTTLQHVTSKSTILPPYSKAPTTSKTKATSTTLTSSSTAKLSTSISTKETTPFTEQISLPKTTRTTPVKSTYTALSTIPLTSKTTKVFTSTQSTIKTVLSKTTPYTTTFQQVTSKSTVSPPFSKAPTTLKTKVTSTTPTSTGTLTTLISTKATTPFTKHMSLPKTTHTTPVKSTYPALISNTTTISTPYPKGSTTLKTKSTVTGTIPLITSKTSKLSPSSQSTIQTVLSKTTPHTITFKHATFKSTVLPLYSKAPTTFKTKVASTTPTTSSTAKLSTSISTKESTPLTKQISFPKTTHTTPVKSSYPAVISKTKTIYSPYSKLSTSLKAKMTMTGTTPLPTSEKNKLHTSTQSTIKTVVSKSPHTTTFQRETSKSTILPPYSKTPTTVKTKISSVSPGIFSDIFANTFETSTSMKKTIHTTTEKTLSRTTSHTKPIRYSTTSSALISKTTFMSPPHSKSPTTVYTKVTSVSPWIFNDIFANTLSTFSTSKTAKLHTSTQSTIQAFPYKSTPLTTTFPYITSKHTTTKYPTITEKTSAMSGKTTKIATTGKESTRREKKETYFRTFSVPTTVGDQCLLISEPINITKGECSTLQAVPMNYCAGRCSTSSMFSHDLESMMRSCFCCLDMEGSSRTVQLTCLDGSTIPYTYYLIQSCSCVAMTCGKPEDTTLRPVT